MTEPALKCENNAMFKQIYTIILFIAFKMAYSCCFSLGGNLDFPEFLKKKFYKINYWIIKKWLIWSLCLSSSAKSITNGPEMGSIVTNKTLPEEKILAYSVHYW